MSGNVDSLQLPWTGRQINTLVKMNRGRLCSICHQKNGAHPEATLEIHVSVS